MHVDIITFHCVDNFGAMLQAYALKERLTQLGFDARIVNFAPGYKTFRYRLLPWRPSLTKRNLRELRYACEVMRRNLREFRSFRDGRRAFRSFRVRRLVGHQPALRFEWQLRFLRGDALIVGSDQIWNATFCGDRPRRAYFGAFPGRRRVISYAASLGGARPDMACHPEFRAMLQHVDAISVREKSLLPFLHSLGREALAVADPTLLLSMEEWSALAAPTPREEAPYILVNVVKNCIAALDFAQELSNRTGLRVIDVTSTSQPIHRPQFERVLDAGPEEFLALVRGARYVLTNKFHPTAFAIIFHKPFLTCASTDSNQRASDLLDELGLSDRLTPAPTLAQIEAPIDWDAVEARRRALVERSERFLLEQLAPRAAQDASVRRNPPPHLFKKRDKCSGCGACADACPQSAIEFWPDAEGFLYPKIDPKKCVGCGSCVRACPLREPAEAPMPEVCYAARFPDREGSASGGAFTALARTILRRGGVVIGAAWMPDMSVAHHRIEREEDLDALRSSKYVQSDCRDAYRAAMEALRAGRWVLFSGTPCQAEAMRRFAGDQPRLITASLVCQGVPSPVLWGNYARHLERKYKGPLSAFNFRDKREANSGATAAWRIGEREFAIPRGQDPYCQMFASRQILRPSCHSCPFATPARATDITIGDAWGLKKIAPEFDDGVGVSLVIPHTEAGRALWEEARAGGDCAEHPMSALMQNRLTSPSPRGPHRFLALHAWRWMPFSRYLWLIGALRGRNWLEFMKYAAKKFAGKLRAKLSRKPR